MRFFFYKRIIGKCVAAISKYKKTSGPLRDPYIPLYLPIFMTSLTLA